MHKRIPTWLIILCITLFGAVLRFYNLDWGGPLWFHPDERNIASAITRISWPNQLDPDFYAYGGFPIYSYYFISHFISQTSLGEGVDFFTIAIIVSRSISATLSVISIPLLYWICNKFLQEGLSWSKSLSKTTALICISLYTISVGNIQYAHYGTFEMWLTFQRLLLFYLAIRLYQKPSTSNIFFTGVLVGLSVATKITNLILIAPILLSLLIGNHKSIKKANIYAKQSITNLVKKISLLFGISVIQSLSLLLISLSFFLITNPIILNKNIPDIVKKIETPAQITQIFHKGFVHSMNVEGKIARGTIKTFYTRHFTNTTPYLYQITHVFPWVSSWPILISFIFGLGYILYRSTYKANYLLVLLMLWIVTQYAFVGLLYVKWTRYVIPLLPYIFMLASIPLGKIWTSKWPHQGSKYPSFMAFAIVYFFSTWIWHTLQGISFLSIYTQQYAPLQAAQWAEKHLPENKTYFSEVYDLGIIPFNSVLGVHNIDLFNFYDLDDQQGTISKLEQEKLQTLIKESDGFIITSRRVWKHSLENPTLFPKAAKFYQQLFQNQLEFRKVYEVQNGPGFGLWNWNDELYAEETFSVFDHPRVQIWMKPTALNSKNYVFE